MLRGGIFSWTPPAAPVPRSDADRVRWVAAEPSMRRAGRSVEAMIDAYHLPLTPGVTSVRRTSAPGRFMGAELGVRAQSFGGRRRARRCVQLAVPRHGLCFE